MRLLLVLVILLSACTTPCPVQERMAPDLNLQGIVLGQSDFDDIYIKFGKNLVKHEGDAGDSRYFNCYFSGEYRVEFVSNSEMTGGMKISQIIIEPNAKKTGSCQKTSFDIASAKLNNGIGIGTPVKIVASTLGEPDEILNGRFTYDFNRDIGSGFVESTTIVLHFSELAKVMSLRMSRITSN
jgi:hypothetical protein